MSMRRGLCDAQRAAVRVRGVPAGPLGYDRPRGGGIIDHTHFTDVESPPPSRVCMSIHRPRGGGVIDHAHLTDVEYPPPPPSSLVCMSIHPKSG